MKSLYAILLLATCSLATIAQDIVITAVYDGPLSGGQPKGVELYTLNAIADLSQYGISSANNGGGTTGTPEYTFPADVVPAGTYIYVCNDSITFDDWFGFAPDYYGVNAMLINGDDAIELFFVGSVYDVFGDVNVDGTGEVWEYMDGWAYRQPGTGPNGGTFVDCNWVYSSPNALDGEVDNASSTTPVPIGTYIPTPLPLTAFASGIDTCNLNATDFIGTALGGQCPYNYSWDFGDGSGTSSLQNPSYVYAAAGTYTVVLTVTDALAGTTTAITSVTVYDKPVAGFSTSASGLCIPVDATFTDASSIGSGSIAGWNWDFDTGGIGGASPATDNTQSPPTVTYSGTGTYTIELIVTSNFGCTDTIMDNVVVNAMDDPSFSYIDSVACEDDAELIPTITGLTGGTFSSGTASVNASSGAVNPALTSIGIHTITYTTSGTCPNAMNWGIEVRPRLDATITNPPGGTICSNAAPITLVGADAGGTWSSNCGSCINGASGLFDPALANVGLNEIIYTITDSCGDADTITIDVQNCPGIAEQSTMAFSLYPNPVSHQLTVMLKSNSSGKLEVLNIVGEVLVSKNYTGELVQIDVNQLPAGTYFISINDGTITTAQRFVKQ